MTRQWNPIQADWAATLVTLVTLVALLSGLLVSGGMLTPSRAAAAGSPTTNVVVYDRHGIATGTIWLRTNDGSSDQQVTTGYYPRLSPDGNYMVFKRGSSTSRDRGDIYVRDMQAGTETKVFSNPDYAVNYSWTADSQQIVFDYYCGIYKMNRDGTGMVTLISRDCYDDAPQLNPANTRIAFHNFRPGWGPSGGIFVALADGTNILHVPNTAEGDGWPAWSPDGVWLSFLRDGNYFKIKPDGTGLTQLSMLSGVKRFGAAGPWTTDGTVLVVPGTVNCQQGLFTLTTDGSQQIKQLPITPGVDPEYAGTALGPTTPAGTLPADACGGSAPSATPEAPSTILFGAGSALILLVLNRRRARRR